METQHIVWSARTCPFRKAGAYYGLTWLDTHPLVARYLLPRRAAAYDGGRTSIRDNEPWPLIYYAIRDPSAVRVVPVKKAIAGGEPPHVQLVFVIENGQARPLPDHLRELDKLEEDGGRKMTGAFVVTIGLPKDKEEPFHKRVILDAPNSPFADLCDRIRDAGRDLGL